MHVPYLYVGHLEPHPETHYDSMAPGTITGYDTTGPADNVQTAFHYRWSKLAAHTHQHNNQRSSPSLLRELMVLHEDCGHRLSVCGGAVNGLLITVGDIPGMVQFGRTVLIHWVAGTWPCSW